VWWVWWVQGVRGVARAKAVAGSFVKQRADPHLAAGTNTFLNVPGRSCVERFVLLTPELAARIKYDSRTIRERLKDSVVLEGKYYIRPFGGRKILNLGTHRTGDGLPCLGSLQT
jgi:hypothetical protein